MIRQTKTKWREASCVCLCSGLSFYPECGGDIYLRNNWVSPNCTVLQSRMEFPVTRLVHHVACMLKGKFSLNLPLPHTSMCSCCGCQLIWNSLSTSNRFDSWQGSCLVSSGYRDLFRVKSSGFQQTCHIITESKGLMLSSLR